MPVRARRTSRRSWRDTSRARCSSRDRRGGARAASQRLAGATRFGDCVDDEWFIVWLLHGSRARSTLVARVWDNGEFLLIGRLHLPRWVKPESVANRAWIRGGRFHLVLPSAAPLWGVGAPAEGGAASGGAKLDVTGGITVEAALWLVRGGDGADRTRARARRGPSRRRLAGTRKAARTTRCIRDHSAGLPARTTPGAGRRWYPVRSRLLPPRPDLDAPRGVARSAGHRSHRGVHAVLVRDGARAEV